MISESHLLPAEPVAKAHMHLSAKKVAIAKEYFAACTKNKWEDVRPLITVDHVYEGAAGLVIKGFDELSTMGTEWNQFSSDCKAEITNSISMDDYVAFEIKWSGTQDGPLEIKGVTFAQEPTYKPFHFKGICICEFEGEKIKCTRLVSDMLGLLVQLGLLKE